MPAVNEQLTDNTSKLQTSKPSASALIAHTDDSEKPKPETSAPYEPAQIVTTTQQTLGDYDKVFLTESSKKQFSIIGQLFKTYWLIEFEDKLYIIDQHAAHEKVLYEKTMARLANKDFTSQRISPPIVMTLDARESEMLEKYRPQIEQFGYEVEHFGGKEYMISAIPDNLFHIDMKDLIKHTGISRRIGTRCSSDWRLINTDNFIQLLQAINTFVFTRNTTCTVQCPRQMLVQNLIDQRTFSGA